MTLIRAVLCWLRHTPEWQVVYNHEGEICHIRCAKCGRTTAYRGE